MENKDLARRIDDYGSRRNGKGRLNASYEKASEAARKSPPKTAKESIRHYIS
jgi:hypothetical protein